jgi:hypothetical protein
MAIVLAMERLLAISVSNSRYQEAPNSFFGKIP